MTQSPDMNAWREYLARGSWQNDQQTVYHMCEVERFNAFFNKISGEYFPPTFEQDGFIHATANPSILMEIANHFYTDSTSEWVCFGINPRLLASKLVYEGAAAVGNKATKKFSEEAENAAAANLFPHIYGGVSKISVTKVFKIVRGSKGEFITIEGLL